MYYVANYGSQERYFLPEVSWLLTSSLSVPSPLAAPYPTQELLQSHAAAMSTRRVYRYHECSGREIRDCLVVGHAIGLLEVLEVYAERVLQSLR